jgi:DNA-directed RNA polymerase specialized sigma24 family protein
MPLPRIAPPLPRTIRLAQTGDDPAREELAAYCRKIAFIFALQGCGDQHEAHALGVPRGTVMSRLHRARRRLGAIITRRKRASEGEVPDA